MIHVQFITFLVSEIIWLVYSTEMKKPLQQLKQVREENLS